jgi:predicted phosphodiesterase
MSRVLVFGDTHIPFMRKGYVEFLKRVYKKYRCDKVVCVGDLFDLHRTGSRHLPDPDAEGAKEEYTKAIAMAKTLYKAFPKALVCIGNHDARYYKGAAEKAFSSVMLPDYNWWTKSPKTWKWAMRHIVDGVVYQHGTAFSGEFCHVNAAKKNRKSTVVGHIHTSAGVTYLAASDDLIFGMATGCGMDSNTYAARYAQEYSAKPIVGCGVVIDGKLAIYEPMDLGSKR